MRVTQDEEGFISIEKKEIKRCYKCHELKNKNEFAKNQRYCTKCATELMRIWRRKNSEKVTLQSKDGYTRTKEWRKSNPEKYAEQKKRYREKKNAQRISSLTRENSNT